MGDQKLNLHVLSHNVGSSVDPLSRIVANGIRKESDKDLVNWLGDLNIGKDVVEKVKKIRLFDLYNSTCDFEIDETTKKIIEACAFCKPDRKYKI